MRDTNIPNCMMRKVELPPLLASDEPNSVTTVRENGNSPFFLTCDHASNRVPTKLGTLGLASPEWKRHIAWDIGALGVAQRLSSLLDAPLIFQNYSRLVIDCNRPFKNPESIPTVSESTLIPANRDLSEIEISSRQDEIFKPYHVNITRLLDKRRQENKTTVFTAIHSFTPVYKGKSRPWDIGILYDKDNRIAKPLLELLKEDKTLTVGDNQPYQVGDEHDYSTPVHGEGKGLPYVIIEIRQDHIATLQSQNDWGVKLRDFLGKLERTLDLF